MVEEPVRRAVALSAHDEGQAARVLAKGYGDVAAQVIAEARRHGIHVHESPELVALLMHLDLDERVPPQLYAVIAELLAWIGGFGDRPARGT